MSLGAMCLEVHYSNRRTNLFYFGLTTNVDPVYDISPPELPSLRTVVG